MWWGLRNGTPNLLNAGEKNGEVTFSVAARLVGIVSASPGPDASDHPHSRASSGPVPFPAPRHQLVTGLMVGQDLDAHLLFLSTAAILRLLRPEVHGVDVLPRQPAKRILVRAEPA